MYKPQTATGKCNQLFYLSISIKRALYQNRFCPVLEYSHNGRGSLELGGCSFTKGTQPEGIVLNWRSLPQAAPAWPLHLESLEDRQKPSTGLIWVSLTLANIGVETSSPGQAHWRGALTFLNLTPPFPSIYSHITKGSVQRSIEYGGCNGHREGWWNMKRTGKGRRGGVLHLFSQLWFLFRHLEV